MRICVFSERMAEPFDEGIKNTALHLMQELSRVHEVLRLTAFGESTAAYGIENVRANRLLLSPALGHRMRRFRPELTIYVPTACATPASFLRSCVLRAHGRGAPVVLVALQWRVYGRLAGLVMPRLGPDLVLVQAERTRASLERFGCRLRTLRPGVDLERFRPATAGRRAELRRAYGADEGSYVLLHVGHLNRGRGIQALLPLQRLPGAQVVVVGSASTSHDQELVTELTRAGVKVLGEHIADMAAVYQMADCYVFPVQGETSAIDVPLSVLEAMACDLPVVTTRFGGLPGLFASARGLRYVGRPEQIVEAVESLRGMTGPGTRRLVEPFAWSRVVDEMLQGVCGDLGLVCARGNLEG